jgi:hypothetical protein
LHIFKFSNVIRIVLFVLLVGVAVNADPTNIEETAKSLPDHLGGFKATTQARPFDDDADFFNGIANVSRDYQSSGGERLTVLLFKSPSDSGAFARLNSGFMKVYFVSGREQEVKAVNVGTSGYLAPTGLFFYKGPMCVVVNASNRPVKSETLLEFGKQFADTLDKGDGDIPALVKHLPGWESGGIHPDYAVNLAGLKENVPNQPVFDALNFAGGVEAVSAHYGALRLVIVEFNTPQLATDNDHGITAKLQELGSQSQPAPTAYRRVGNYAVFVFDAPTQEAANQLIDQVKYQQVVQWLGENPFSYEKATREFTETTLGVLVAVVKTSGLALLSCLAVGGFFGALLFRFRRAQQRATDSYSDADAMIRLNLDELTPESDPGRLLGRRE